MKTEIIRLFTHIKTGYTGVTDDEKIAFWVVAIKVENEKLYLMVTDGTNQWRPQGPEHPDLEFANEGPGICDNTDAIDQLSFRGWVSYLFSNDSAMYEAADFIRDVYQNAIKL